MRKPTALHMWAVVIIGPRIEWIHQYTIRRTRKDAVEAYLVHWLPEYVEKQRKLRNKKWRVVPVIVTCNEEAAFR
jgi:hypothetical protein